MSINKQFLPVFLLANLILSSAVHAMESDASQPISIDSNAGFYDDKKGVSIYTGEVIIIQGSMRLEADKLVVYLENREVQKMVATGTPVKFKQTPEAGKEDVHGSSLTAEYFPETKELIMTREAVIWQGGNSTKSEKIIYNRTNEVLKAGSGESAKARVHIILHPKKSENKQ